MKKTQKVLNIIKFIDSVELTNDEIDRLISELETMKLITVKLLD